MLAFHFVVVMSLMSFVSAQLSLKLFAGTGTASTTGDNGPATSATFSNTRMIYADTNGVAYIADDTAAVVRKVDTSGIITTIGGQAGVSSRSGAGNNGQWTSATLLHPFGMHGDTAGQYLYMTDEGYLWRYDLASGVGKILAGTSSQGYSGDGGPGTSAQMNNPLGVWVGTNGLLYVADADGNADTIRTVDAAGIIRLFAGQPAQSGFVDNIVATSGKLASPHQLWGDTYGNLFIADYVNCRIRKVNTANILSTYAGVDNSQSYSGDGGQATSAQLSRVRDVKGDNLGNIFIADSNNYRIRKVNSAGIITTVVGTGSDSGTAVLTTQIALSAIGNVAGLWVDSLSNVYICEGTKIVRKTFMVYPTSQPSGQPSRQPTGQPSRQPITTPTAQPSRQPSTQPSGLPTSRPSHPTSQPTDQPSSQPIGHPTGQPTNHPLSLPSSQPSGRPSGQPSRMPLANPSGQPTSNPSSAPSWQAESYGTVGWSKRRHRHGK
jgi:hypothetical protein